MKRDERILLEFRKRMQAGLALALPLLLVWLPAFAQKGRPKPVDAFLSGPAFTFDQALLGVQKLQLARIKAGIEHRGVAFYPDAGQIQQLKAAGADAQLIALIESKGLKFKKPDAAPAPAFTGPITLTCAPAECEIAVNGTPAGKTQGGELHVKGVSVGSHARVVVDFKKDGYIGDQLTLPVKAGAPVKGAKTLLPTNATQEKFGGQLLAAAMNKLGGANGLRDAGLLVATGKADLFLSNGKRDTWSIVAKVKAQAALTSIDMAGSGVKWWVSLKGMDSKQGGSKELRGGDVAGEMEKVAHQFSAYQPALLLNRFRTAKLTLWADAPAPDSTANVVLKASGGAESYEVTITPAGLPQQVKYASRSGLGSGLTVTYGDYTVVGATKYPKSFDIRFPEKEEHGIELRFSQVSTNPRMSDRELHR